MYKSTAEKLNKPLDLGLEPMRGPFERIVTIMERSKVQDAGFLKCLAHFIFLARECTKEEGYLVDEYFGRLIKMVSLESHQGTMH